jgi:hypothetical protein
MQQGDRNAPSVWQRAMQEGFSEYLFVFLTCYIDDSTVSTNTPADPKRAKEEFVHAFEQIAEREQKPQIGTEARAYVASSDADLLYIQHVVHNFRFLNRVRKWSFTLSFEKSSVFTTSFELLGYKVTPQGVTLTEKRISGFKAWPRPLLITPPDELGEERDTAWCEDVKSNPYRGHVVNVRAIRTLMGALNFQRRFLKNFSAIAEPLQAYVRPPREMTDYPRWSDEAER